MAKWSSKEWLEKLTPEAMEEMQKQLSDLFEPEEVDAEQNPEEEEYQKSIGKATFYLPVSLIDELEKVYITSRMIGRRKITKSEIVRRSLEIYLELAEKVLGSMIKRSNPDKT